MSSLPEAAKRSIEFYEFTSTTYVYDRDIPTKIRPHDRHRLEAIGDPPVPTIGRTSPCPCQLNFDVTPKIPFATAELERDFWSKLHLMQRQRDIEDEARLLKGEGPRDRARYAAAQKAKDKDEGSAQTGEDKGEGFAQKTATDSSDSKLKEKGRDNGNNAQAVELQSRALQSGPRATEHAGKGKEYAGGTAGHG